MSVTSSTQITAAIATDLNDIQTSGATAKTSASSITAAIATDLNDAIITGETVAFGDDFYADDVGNIYADDAGNSYTDGIYYATQPVSILLTDSITA